MVLSPDMTSEAKKRDRKVNAFKAPEDWLQAVARVAAERGMTQGRAIQWLVDIALPLYEQIKESEERTIEGLRPKTRASPSRKVSG